MRKMKRRAVLCNCRYDTKPSVVRRGCVRGGCDGRSSCTGCEVSGTWGSAEMDGLHIIHTPLVAFGTATSSLVDLLEVFLLKAVAAIYNIILSL